MGRFTLENEKIKVMVDEVGAELVSLVKKESGTEYMWNADPAYWKRVSPVLFPLVGNLKKKEYRYNGQTYTMGQHGFARDKKFEMIKEEKDEIWFRLTEDEESLQIYPFAFQLDLGYKLNGFSVELCWRVENSGNKDLHFSIGGHPAFLCPLREGEKQTDYFLQFDSEEDILYTLINEEGLTAYPNNLLPLNDEDGTIEIPEHLFDGDALVIENRQAKKVSLLTPEKEAYITVEFDTPLFGVWSPAKKNAPFICIEPWYGRCDGADFNGTLEEREYGNVLAPQGIFEASYTITVGV